MNLRWGLIGTGVHAERWIVPAFRRAARGRLVGVVGSTHAKAQAFAERVGGVKVYPSLDELLNDGAVDAVFICTPNHLHREQTERAATAGKHVLVEKPMALTVADCRAMIDACHAAGVRLGVGFHLRHHPVHQELRRLAAEGDLGRIVLARAEWHTSYAPWTNWRADPARAGADVVAAVGVHALDLLCYLVGAEVREMSGWIDRSPETGRDQTVACWLAFDNGAAAVATTTCHSAWPLNSVQLCGTKGTAGGVGTIGMAPAGILRQTRGSEIAESEWAVPDLYAAELDAFAAAVEQDVEPNASGLDGLRSVSLTQRLLGAESLEKSP